METEEPPPVVHTEAEFLRLNFPPEESESTSLLNEKLDPLFLISLWISVRCLSSDLGDVAIPRC
jgi:hypothetical protein